MSHRCSRIRSTGDGDRRDGNACRHPGGSTCTVLAKPVLPVIAKETVTGDPPAARFTLGVLATMVKLEGTGAVLLLSSGRTGPSASGKERRYRKAKWIQRHSSEDHQYASLALQRPVLRGGTPVYRRGKTYGR